MALARLERAAAGASRWLALVGLILLMGLAFATLADGLLRWAVNRPIEGVRDAGALAIAVAVSCAFPAVFIERGNISIRIVEKLLGAAASRVLDAFAALLVFGVLCLMAWQFHVYAAKIARGNETTWVLQIPTAPFWFVVEAVIWCAALVQFIVFLRDAGRVFRPSAGDSRGGGHG